MRAILETVDLVKYYGDGDNMVKAIDHTDISVERGEFVAVVGRCGLRQEHAASYAGRT